MRKDDKITRARKKGMGWFDKFDKWELKSQVEIPTFLNMLRVYKNGTRSTISPIKEINPKFLNLCEKEKICPVDKILSMIDDFVKYPKKGRGK